MIDYEILRVIWWLLLGTLLAGFAIMDGFDLGVGILLHRVAKTNDERRVVLNTIGPTWEGNQVWLILGGGAIFAAWPALYALSFSGFYLAMLLVLFGLILRPVGFKYRSKIDNTRWRGIWDFALFLGGLVPALVFGVAMGNVLEGAPFYFDETFRSFYNGDLLGLSNPFALLCGLVSVAMLMMHGAVYLCIKIEGAIQVRARNYAKLASVLTIVLFAIAGWWVANGITGFILTSTPAVDAPSNPFLKTVTTAVGAWMNNYHHYPLLKAVPALGFLGAFSALLLVSSRYYRLAWIASALSIGGIIATLGVSMFPFILPSTINPNLSLMVWDASSSQLTLFIMLIATIIFLPLILLYTSWVYYIMRGKVTTSFIQKNQSDVY